MLSCRGGGEGCPGQFILTPTHLSIKVKLFANSTYFKLSECEDVLIINILQVKFTVFFVALFNTLSCRGGGKLSRPVYSLSCPPPPPPAPTWVSKLIYFAKSTCFKLCECDDVSIINIVQVEFQLFSFTHCLVCLIAGVGASCPGQFILPPPTLVSK